MPNWKDLFANRERRQFPEVVVPLASDPTPRDPNTSHAKNKDHPTDTGSNTSLDHGSVQEKGVVGTPTITTKLTLETLRAEVEADVGSSGHDSAYDRTSRKECAGSAFPTWTPRELGLHIDHIF